MTTASLPRVPEGLRDLMKVYTKEVLREKPSDLYEFSAKFFNMIVGEKSHQAVRKYEPAQTYETIMKNRIRQQVPISMVFNIIPENLTDLIKQFIKAVLREKPDNIYIFAQEYFQRLSKEKSGRTEYKKYATYENSLKDKENLGPVAKVTCECGRVLSAKAKDVENNTVLIEKEEKESLIMALPKKDDDAKNVINMTYIRSVVIIQRHFRRYLKRVKTDRNKKDKCNSMEYMTSILLLQRQFRRLNAKKRVKKLKLSRLNEPKGKVDTANYMKAVLIIQKHYRLYLKQKQEQNRLENDKVSLATAAIIIQRAFRRMLAVHKARRITSASADHPEDLNDNASETGSYTSVSTALLSTESTELGGTNYEERVHQKIIHEDEEVENSNVDGGLEKEYFAEPIKSDKKSIHLRKSDTLSGPLIDNQEDHENNEYSEFEVKKQKEEIEDEFRAIKKRDTEIQAIPEHTLERQDELQSLENVDNIKINETIPPPKVIKSESQLQATPTISIEHVDDSPEENSSIPSESNESPKQPSIDNDKEKPVESLVSNTSRDKHDQESLKQASVDNDKEEPVESLASKACKDGKHSIDDDMEKRVESLVSNTSRDKHDQESLKHTSVDNDKEEPVESLASKACKDGQPSIDDDMEKRVESLVSSTSWDKHDQESLKHTSVDNDKEEPVESLASKACKDGQPSIDDDMEKRVESLVSNAKSPKQSSIDTDLEKPIESLNSNSSQEGHDQESLKQPSIDTDLEKPIESLNSNASQERHDQESPKQILIDNDPEKPVESLVSNFTQEIQSTEDTSSKDDEKDTVTDPIYRAKRSLEEIETNLDKIMENSKGIGEETKGDEFVEKEVSLKNSNDQIDPDKVKEISYEKREEKQEIEQLGNSERDTDTGKDSIENEEKLLTLGDEVEEIKTLGDDIKNDTSETISGIREAISGSTDAIEVSDEKLLKKQSSNEVINELENNEKEHKADPNDKEVVLEGSHSRSQQSPEKNKIDVDSDNNSKNISEETKIQNALIEEGDYEPLLLSGEKVEGKPTTEEIEANKDHPVDHLANKDEILIPTKSQEELLHNQESASTDDEIKPVAATDLKEDLVQISLNAVEDSVFAIAHMKDKNSLDTESDSGNGQEKELSENDSKIKTKELTNLDDVDIKETQTSNGVPSASDEKDVPDSKAEKIDSIPSKTEKNSSLLVSNQLIGTQNLPTNPIEIEKNTKKYSSVNVKDKDIGTLSSGRLVPTPIAELQLKSFKNTNDDGAWYDIYVENQIPIDTDSGKTTDSVQSIQIDADRPGEIIEEPIIPQERVPSYYTPQKIVEPEIPKVKNSVSFFVSFDSDDGKPKYKIPKKFQNQSKTNIPEKSQLKAYSDSTKPGEIETSTADDNENEEEIEVIEVSEGDPEYQQMAGTKLQTILELNENEQPSDLQNEGNEAELENPLPTTKKSDYDFETIYKADILSLTKSVQIIERAFKRFKNKSQEVPENQNVEIDEAKANNAAQVIQKWIRNILIKKSSKLSSDIVEDNHKILAPRKIQRAYRNYVEKLKKKIEKHNNAVLIIQKAFRLYSQRNKAKQNKMKSDENDVRQNDAATKIQRTFKRYLKLIKNPDVVIQNQSKKIEEVQESVNSNIVTTQEPIPEPNNAPKDDLKLEAKAVLIIQRAFRQYLERKKLETLEENSFDSQSITSSRITTIENVNYPTDATPTDSLVQESVENTPEIKPKSEWYVGSTRIIPSQEVVGEPLEINQELAASARKSTQVVESIETVDSSHGSLESKLNSGTKFDEIVGKDIEKDNALSCGLAGPEDAVEAESGSNEDDILLTQSNLDKIERDILSTQELVNNFLEKEIEFSSAQGPYENSSPEEVVEETCIKKSASLVNISETETGDPTDSSLSETTGLDTLSADTIDKATVKLAKPEEVIEKMSQLRESRSQTSQERIQSGDASFEESVVRPMSSLQEQSSLDIEDGDIIVYNRLQRDETRESSAQSDSVVFGDPETEKIVEKDEESGRVHLMRHYTIAGDDPRGLFRSVTIDDALNYEEDMDSGHGIKSTASFYLDDETSENIRKKMMAYSLSETDSDYIDPRKVSQEDFDVDTAMADAMGTSTETESTIVSAATKIQAGARGFLTRRRLRRASAGTKSSTQDTKASFGNDAISESLERFIEEEAAKKIQAAYRIHTRKRKGYPRKMEGISLESNLAARRQKLQRGDALRNDSTPDDEHSVATNGGQTQKVAKPPRHKLVGDAKSRAAMELKWLTMRQNSMPVQIDCEVFRVIPKHMRKRIKSADANKRK
nr:titin [Drosophila bipectinata]